MSDSGTNCGLIGYYHTTNTTYLCKSVTVSNCYSTQPLKGSTVADSTSIEHYSDSAVISEGRMVSMAVSLGDANISSPSTVGGLVGYFSSGASGAEVSNCYHAGTYSFTVDTLPAAELRAVLDMQIYHGDTPVSQVLRYSPDTYGNGKTGALGDLCKALFAYSDSARAYFA